MSTIDPVTLRLPAPLIEAAELVSTMEQAIADAQWASLSPLAEGFRGCLLALQQPLAEAALRRDPAEFDALQAALGAVLARHDAMLETLVDARERTAEELEGAVQGHHGANQYLLAAGGA